MSGMDNRMRDKQKVRAKGNLIYSIEGVIGDYLDEWATKDLPYKDIRGLSEHLVEWLEAIEFDIKYMYGEKDDNNN